MVASTANCAPCQSGSPLATTLILRSSWTRFMSAMRTLRTTWAPASWQTRAVTLKRRRGQDPGCCTGRAVVAVLIEARAASACTRRKLHGQAQAAQKKDTELGARDADLWAYRQHMGCVRGVQAGLRQQQRSRCRVKVGRMHLKRALITSGRTPALPAAEGVPNRDLRTSAAAASPQEGAAKPRSRRNSAAGRAAALTLPSEGFSVGLRFPPPMSSGICPGMKCCITGIRERVTPLGTWG